MNSSLVQLNKKGFWIERNPPKDSLHKAAKLFDEIEGKTIIEIGTGIQGEMSGNSVLVWAKETNAQKIVCLDLEQKHIDEVAKACKDFSAVETRLEDGLRFLKKFRGKIDLLYLDFWVPDKEGDVEGTARAKSYLKAFNNAIKKMSSNSIILIDDTDHIDPWKQTLIVPEARKYGYEVLWVGRQTCLYRNA